MGRSDDKRKAIDHIRSGKFWILKLDCCHGSIRRIKHRWVGFAHLKTRTEDPPPRWVYCECCAAARLLEKPAENQGFRQNPPPGKRITGSTQEGPRCEREPSAKERR